MKTWLATLPLWLARGDDCVLVTVTAVGGSTPREAGASMLVALSTPLPIEQSICDTAIGSTQKTRQVDTIGGGHLEWQASQIAHDMLKSRDASIRLERFNLGARLGQCCGGVVWVVFEKIAADQAQVWQQRLEQIKHTGLTRRLTSTGIQSDWQLSAGDDDAQGLLFQQQTDDWQLQQPLCSLAFSVVIFGAGHVGLAVVQALRALQADIRWVDSREEAFPSEAYPNVSYICTDHPESEVATAPPNSYFLIMTHNHALDLSLCQAVFKRSDFAYFGLIGSRSKRVVFELRLQARGVSSTRMSQMICPIGIPGIASKEPAAIAIAVVAELLQIRYTRQHSAIPIPFERVVGQD